MMGQIDNDLQFLQWVLPRLNYRWAGFRKPRGQVIKRIRNRMQELGLSGGYGQYRIYLEKNPSEWDTLDKLFDVTISKFFRDRAIWDYLQKDLLRNLLLADGPHDVAIWSAGCCNGEESYSAAIVVEMISDEVALKRSCSILATDRNSHVLRRAKKGEYPAEALKELNREEIQSFFEKIESNDADYRIRNHIQQHVEFECRDIRSSLPERSFDIIFCRNLAFTYFSGQEQARFLERLELKLNPGGYLIIGSNENLPLSRRLEHFHRSHPVYRKI